MEINKRVVGFQKNQSEFLNVQGILYFDGKECFCGQPWINLLAYTEPSWCWKTHQITIAIHDQDDYDIGFIYSPSKEKFFVVLHELINWINDLEHGIICYDDFIEDVEGFFPDCKCKREWR